ncbi:hypothetical protein TNCV_2196421 [Trichonephila clavipes]|nr:hypothetical protein TNCV_2196421 [Trichonephila clavipes]
MKNESKYDFPPSPGPRMVRSRARKRRPVNFSPHAPSIKANGLSPSAIASELSFLRFSTLFDGCIARHKWKNTSTADRRFA